MKPSGEMIPLVMGRVTTTAFAAVESDAARTKDSRLSMMNESLTALEGYATVGCAHCENLVGLGGMLRGFYTLYSREILVRMTTAVIKACHL
jgi:hypothetical protein